MRAVYDTDTATDSARTWDSLNNRRLKAKATQQDLIKQAIALLHHVGVGLTVPAHRPPAGRKDFR